MRSALDLLRRAAPTATVLLAILKVDPSAAQGACVTTGNAAPIASLTSPCTFGGVTAQFGGSPAGTIQNSNLTITLTAGWVYIQPTDPALAVDPALPVDETTAAPAPAPVKVSTTYTTTLSPSIKRPWWSLPGFRERDRGQLEGSISQAGTYLVEWVSSNSVTVALMSGTMDSPPGLLPGCQMTFTTPNVLPPAAAISGGPPSIPSTLPASCICPATVSGLNSNLTCTLGTYNATFAAGSSATTDGASAINLTAGAVAVESYNSSNSALTVTTGYTAKNGSEVFTVSNPTTTGVTPSGRPNPSFLVGMTADGDSAYVAVETGAVTTSLATSQPLTRGYQMTYWDASPTSTGHRHRTPVSAVAQGVLCSMGLLPDCE